jgi:hypothetical protein
MTMQHPESSSPVSFRTLTLFLLTLTGLSANLPSAFSSGDESIITRNDEYYCRGNTHANTSKEIFAQSLPDDGSVWRVGTNRWSEALDQAYAQWVEKEVDADFYVEYKIPTDCADAALFTRIIFARIYSLPVVYLEGNQSFASQATRQFSHLKTIPHWSRQNWKTSLKEDTRFRQFLLKIGMNMGTKNLGTITHPIKVQSCTRPGSLSEYVRPGAILMDDGHTRLISKVDTLDAYFPITQVNSTSIPIVRSLYQGSAEIHVFKEKDRGILAFTWVNNCDGQFKPIDQTLMPNFSNEQYTLFNNKNTVVELVKMTPGVRKTEISQNYIDRVFDEIIQKINQRIQLVQETQIILNKDPQYFKTHPAAADDYSTPSLDMTISNKITFLEYLLSSYSFTSAYEYKIKQKLTDYIQQKLKNTTIHFAPHRFIYLSDFSNFMNNSMAHDPNSSLEDRWGFNFYRQRLQTLQEDLVEKKKNYQDYLKNRSWLKAKADQLGIYNDETNDYFISEIKRITDEIVRIKKTGTT